MRHSGEMPLITNIDELIDGIQILYGVEVLTLGDRRAAARLVDELVEIKGKKSIHILRALVRGEIAADDALEKVCAPPY